MRSVRVAALLFAAYALVFSALGSVMLSYRAGGQPNVITTDDRGSAHYVGSLTCVQCHPREHKDWQTSQHASAMQEANDKTVLGHFDGSTFSHGGVTSTFFKKDEVSWVTLRQADGELADYEVSYTFGLFPLQQYLIGMPKGRLQALGVAWGRANERGGRPASVCTLSRSQACAGGSPALDRDRPKLELSVRLLPRDQSQEELRRRVG